LVDLPSLRIDLIRAKEMHEEVSDFLKEVNSDYHEIAAKTLAVRIEMQIIDTINKAISKLDIISSFGIENMPKEIISKWIKQINSALAYGGEYIDLKN